jgi:hypothetical protein
MTPGSCRLRSPSCSVPRRLRMILARRVIVLAMMVFVLVRLSTVEGAPADEAAHFVGIQACTECHAAAAQRWASSHHALAIQRASPVSVLGDFADAKFDHFGVVTSFSRSGDKFLVRMDGPDGALHEYEIAHTFGVYPLQQYLIAMPGGRLQAFGVAWAPGRRSRGPTLDSSVSGSKAARR